MELKIKIELGVTQVLENLLNKCMAIADGATRLEISKYMDGHIGCEPPTIIKDADLVAAEKPVAPTAPQEPQVPTPAETPVETPAPAAEPAAPVAPAQLAPEDVRNAMRATRARIIGPDWETNKTSDNYKRWYKPLTAWFKTTAAECGAEKPSQLPDHESRKNFINQCETVEIVDGVLGQPLPF